MGKDKRGVDRGACERCKCKEYEMDMRPDHGHECSYCKCPPTHHVQRDRPRNSNQAFNQQRYGERMHRTGWKYDHGGQLSDNTHQRAMGYQGRSYVFNGSQQFHHQNQPHGMYPPQQSQDWPRDRPPATYQQVHSSKMSMGIDPYYKSHAFSQPHDSSVVQSTAEYYGRQPTSTQVPPQPLGRHFSQRSQEQYPRQQHGSNIQSSQPAPNLPQGRKTERAEGIELHCFQGEPYKSHNLRRGKNDIQQIDQQQNGQMLKGPVNNSDQDNPLHMSKIMGEEYSQLFDVKLDEVENGMEKIQLLQQKLKKLEERQTFVKRELDCILGKRLPANAIMDPSIQVHATQQQFVEVKDAARRVHELKQELKRLADEQMSVTREIHSIIKMEMEPELSSSCNFDVQSQSSCEQKITGKSVEIEKNMMEPKSESPQKQKPEDPRMHVGREAPAVQQQVSNKPQRKQQATTGIDGTSDADGDGRSGKDGENLIKPDHKPLLRQGEIQNSGKTSAGQQHSCKIEARTQEPSTQPVATPGDKSSNNDSNVRLDEDAKTLIKSDEYKTSVTQNLEEHGTKALVEEVKASDGFEQSSQSIATSKDDSDADRDVRPDTNLINPELQSPPKDQSEESDSVTEQHGARVEPKAAHGSEQLQPMYVKVTAKGGISNANGDDRSGDEGSNLIKPDHSPPQGQGVLDKSGETSVQEEHDSTLASMESHTPIQSHQQAVKTEHVAFSNINAMSPKSRNLEGLSSMSSPGGSVPSESKQHSMLEKDSPSYIAQDPRSASVCDSEMSSGEYFSASSSEMAGFFPQMLDGHVATHKDVTGAEMLKGQCDPTCSSKTSQEEEATAFSPEISTGQDALSSSIEMSDDQDTVSKSDMSKEQSELATGEETSKEQSADISGPDKRQSESVSTSSVHPSPVQKAPVTSLDTHLPIPGQNTPVPNDETPASPTSSNGTPGSQHTLDLSDVTSTDQNAPVADEETSRDGIEVGQRVPVSSPDMPRGQNTPVSKDKISKEQTVQVSISDAPSGPNLSVSSLDTRGNQTAPEPKAKTEALLPSNLDKSKEEGLAATTLEKSALYPEARAQKTKTNKEVQGASCSSDTGEKLSPDQGYSTVNQTPVRKKVEKDGAVKQKTPKSRQPQLKWMDQYHMFHQRVHGKNIHIESNGTTARRNHYYGDGICFSQSPVKVGCKVHLKIIESKEFKGSMRFGFTLKDPDQVKVDTLPAHSYPQIQKGFWIKPLHDKLAQQGNVITYMVDSSGVVFYSINGEDKGLFFSGVDVSGSLWAVLDIHGSTIAVQFADDEAVCEVVSKTFHKGDLVNLDVDGIETLQLLHEGHEGMAEGLQEAIGETGVAIRIDEDEFVHVYFKNHKRVWSINPAALLKVGQIEPSSLITEGDLVMIRTDKDQMRDLLKGHGEFVKKMESTLGKIGRVTKITDQGHLCVKVGDNKWRYNPEAVKKIMLPPGGQSGICDKGLHYWTGVVAKVCTRCGECTSQGAQCKLKDSPLRPRGSPCGCREKKGGCADCGLCRSCAGETEDDDDQDDKRLRRLMEEHSRRAEGSHVHEKETHGIAEGDNVRVTMNQRTLPVIHKQHGLEWHENILQVVGMEGTVTKVTAKCVAVQFPNQTRWHLAPGCLRRSLIGRDGVLYRRGDLVRVTKDEAKLRKLQSHTGLSYKRNMEATLGKTGCVMHYKDGKVKVDVTGKTWWFSPAALYHTSLRERHAHVKDGDYVMVDVEAEVFKNSQVCHGGYVDDMKKLLEQVGIVHHIDIDGDAVVYYPDGTRWCINPLSLKKLAPEECGPVDVSGVLEVGDWVKVESDKDRIRYVQEGTDGVRWQTGYYDAAGKVGQVNDRYPFNEVISVQIESTGYPLNPALLSRASRADLIEVFGSGDITGPGLARGDLVKIAVDFNKLRMLQDGHGGFWDKMDELIGHIGSVSFIDEDGDVYVRFSPRRFCLNPYALTKVTPEEDTFNVGDLLLIEPDHERFRNLQKPSKHGGFSSNMVLACGKTGRLLNVHDRDRLRVKVLGSTIVLNPQLVKRQGNPGLRTGDWKSATICASGKHDWSTGRCLVCVTCEECTHYGNLCPARDKPGRFPGSLCGCGNGHAGCDDCGTCKRCAGELEILEEVDDEDHDHEVGRQGAVKEMDVHVGERQSTSSDKAAGHSEISVVLRKMGQAIELMRKSDEQAAVNVKSTLQDDVLVPFEKYKSSNKLMGDHLANIDGADVLSAQYLKFATGEDVRERYLGTSIQSQCLALLHKVLIHCTDCSVEFCRALASCSILTKFLADLSALNKEAQSKTIWPTIRSLLTVLYNCARPPENKDYFPSHDVTEVLKLHLRSKDERIRITAFSFLSFIVENDNLHLIRLHVDIAELIMSLLNEALDNPEHNASQGGTQYTALQITTILTGLLRNDENKKVFVKHGVVDKLIMLMESGDEEEKECAILCVQKLAYNDCISTMMKDETRVEEVLKALREDRRVSTAVRTALKILEDGPPEKVTDMVSRKSVGPGSIMISTIEYSDLSVGGMVAGGGFGRVYRGYHKRWMMPVAVKELRPLSKEQSLRLSKALIEEAKFMHQARNAYRFIVPLYGVCVTEKFTALVMDFMENGSVGDLLSKVKPLPVPWALKWRILHETILGMNFLHSLDPKIIHHDLKIQNVLVDEDFHAKIADFGLSEYKQIASGGKDEKGGICGTITHIPPEYFAEPYLKAGEKFDVYSFGVLIWEILTGREPFEAVINSSHIRLAVMKGQRPDIKLIPKKGPNELPFFNTLMEECWHPNAEKRPTFRSLAKRVGEVIQRTNLEVAEAIHDVRSALLAKEEERASQDADRRNAPTKIVAGALVT